MEIFIITGTNYNYIFFLPLQLLFFSFDVKGKILSFSHFIKLLFRLKSFNVFNIHL